VDGACLNILGLVLTLSIAAKLCGFADYGTAGVDRIVSAVSELFGRS
jgi:hypothetical protein